MRCIVANLVDGGGNELAEVGSYVRLMRFLQKYMQFSFCYTLCCMYSVNIFDKR